MCVVIVNNEGYGEFYVCCCYTCVGHCCWNAPHGKYERSSANYWRKLCRHSFRWEALQYVSVLVTLCVLYLTLHPKPTVLSSMIVISIDVRAMFIALRLLSTSVKWHRPKYLVCGVVFNINFAIDAKNVT